MRDADKFLAHFGIKGMKWGVRRERYSELRNMPLKAITITTKNGEKVDVTQNRNSQISSFLGSLSLRGTNEIKKADSFEISVNGKRVGAAAFYRVSKDEINLEWLGINPEHRGKGYASAVFSAAVEMGKANGAKRLTLEVPGNAPDAKHIYEKQGFVATGKHNGEDNDYWQGLSDMVLEFEKIPVNHSAMSDGEELEWAILQTFPQMGDVEHSATDKFLAHWGIVYNKGGD